MDPHAHHTLLPADSRRLESLAWPLFAGALIVGAVGLVLALLISLFVERGLARFGHAYLAAYVFVLSLSLGGLFFTMATHLFRAGWSVLVRRVTEVLAASVPAMAVLALPLLVYVVAWNGALYPWAQDLPDAHGGHHDEAGHTEHGAHDEHGETDGHAVEHEPHGRADDAATLVFAANDAAADAHAHPGVENPPTVTGQHDLEELDTAVAHGVETVLDKYTLAHGVHTKGPWFTGWFWTLRLIGYFVVWSILGLWFWKTSTRQDLTGDATLTRKMEILSAPGLILFGATLTFGAFDLLMSLDPTWFSTMYGIYYFAGTFQATMAATILLVMALQAKGFLPSVTREHYHDLGKLMFAFVVFWAYVTFSQYMLIWYAAIPAEQPWMIMRGMSTNNAHDTPWQAVALLMLFGRFVIPFLGLMSRHVKRRKAPLAFWSAWLLVMHAIDMWWNVLPSFDPTTIHVPIIELLCLLGVLGLFAAVAVRIAARHSLVAIGDPRVPEALSFRNI